MLKQVHLYIKGDVIGVGFRAWTKIQAKIIGVTGWVKNVDDDWVEAQIQGEGETVKQIIELIKKARQFPMSPTSKSSPKNQRKFLIYLK